MTLVDLIKARDPRLVCQTCGGSGKKTQDNEWAEGEHVVVTKGSCTCQDHERMVMQVVDNLHQFWKWDKDYDPVTQSDRNQQKVNQRICLVHAAIALARGIVARGIEPSAEDCEGGDVILLIHLVTNYSWYRRQEDLPFWAGTVIAMIYSLAEQHRVNLDEAVAARLGESNGSA